MKTVYGKLMGLIFVLTIALALFLPMRFGQEDHLYAYPHNLRMNRGDHYRVTYMLDSDHAQAISYTSVDESIATVSKQGMVTAVNPGMTDIRLDAEGGAKTTIHVEVVGVPTTEIALNTDSLTMEKGQVTGLTVSFNEGADDTRVEWGVEDGEIAAVDGAGRVTALRGGRTRVYALSPTGLKAEADVFVHVSGNAMRLRPEALTVGTGTALQMGATYFPDDTTDEIVRWVTSDAHVMSVDADGTIHALTVGQPVLTAYTAEGLSNSAVINIERSADSFDVTPSAATLERGEALDLEPRFLDAEGNIDSASEAHYIQWSSSDPSIATVKNGHVEAIKSGETVISASADGMTATCALKVQVLVHEVTLNRDEVYLLREDADKPIQLTARVRPNDPDDPTITWLTSNDLVANVSPSGLVTLTGGYGTAVITARAASGAEAHFTVNIVTRLPEPTANPNGDDQTEEVLTIDYQDIAGEQ